MIYLRAPPPSSREIEHQDTYEEVLIKKKLIKFHLYLTRKLIISVDNFLRYNHRPYTHCC